MIKKFCAIFHNFQWVVYVAFLNVWLVILDAWWSTGCWWTESNVYMWCIDIYLRQSYNKLLVKDVGMGINCCCPLFKLINSAAQGKCPCFLREANAVCKFQVLCNNSSLPQIVGYQLFVWKLKGLNLCDCTNVRGTRFMLSCNTVALLWTSFMFGISS